MRPATGWEVLARDVQAEQRRQVFDSEKMQVVILKHLWIVSAKRCLCGVRSPVRLGEHYQWWAGHVGHMLAQDGFGEVKP